MKKPPGQVDERACRILEDVVSSPDGRIELGEEDRSKLERYQTEFYYLLEKTGDLRFIESITGILDRIAALIPRMLSKALGLRIAGGDTDSAARYWASMNEKIDIDLIDLHLRPLQEISQRIFTDYHKFSKPIHEKSIKSVTYDDTRRDYLLLGEELGKLFNTDGLFLNLEDYLNLEIKEEPQLFTDEEITITERIQRFELYCGVLERDVGDLDFDTIIEIAESYWQRGDTTQNDRNSCLNLLQYAIDRADDQNIGGQLIEASEELGDKYLIMGRTSDAEELFASALKRAREFGNDSSVAMLLTKLADSRIRNPDSNISAAQVELADAENIWLLYGHKKNLLFTISVKVKLHITRSNYDAAKEEILAGMRLYEKGFHPRSRWKFLYSCSEYLIRCPDKDMNSFGMKILDQAISLARRHGEFSHVISSLRRKVRHSEGLALATARSQLESLSKLQEDLDTEITNFAREYQGGLKEIEDFVGKLAGENYRQGLRKASFLVPIDEVEGMEAEYVDSYEGEYGRYRSLDRQQRPLRKQGDLASAIRSLEELERLADEFDSDFFKTKNLEHRFHCIKIDPKAPSDERRKLLGAKKELVSEIISNWTRLDSSVGVMRWKNQLAMLLQREDTIPSKAQSIELMEEIQDFFRGKDARRYAHSRFNYIEWTHADESVDSIAEYEALSKDPALSGDPKLFLELFRRRAVYLHRNGMLKSAIEMISKANELAAGRHEAQEKTPFSDVLYMVREVQWLIEDQDVAAAEEKLATFDRIARRDWYEYSARLSMELKASIENLRGNKSEAKLLYRNAIKLALEARESSSDKSPRSNDISDLYRHLWDMNIDLKEFEDAEKVLIEKIHFDAENGLFSHLSRIVWKNIRRIMEDSSEEEAKEFLFRLSDDGRVPEETLQWILSQLHIELKEWDEAEMVLKRHLVTTSELEKNHLIAPTIDSLVRCCNKKGGPEHTICVLRELAGHNNHSIASSSLNALIELYGDRGESEMQKEMLRKKIDHEIDNEELGFASHGYRKLARLHMERGEPRVAIEVLKEKCERLTEPGFVKSALVDFRRIFTDAMKSGDYSVAQEATQTHALIQVTFQIPYQGWEHVEEEIESTIPEFENMDANQLESKIHDLIIEYIDRIKERDELNSKVNLTRNERDEYNNQRAELDKKVQSKKKIRNEMQEKVQDSRRERKTRDANLKELRERIRSAESRGIGIDPQLRHKLNEAERKQNSAHDAVMEWVGKSDKAHESMLDLSGDYDALRKKADATHKAMEELKNKADSAHKESISLYYRIQGATRVQMGAL